MCIRRFYLFRFKNVLKIFKIIFQSIYYSLFMCNSLPIYPVRSEYFQIAYNIYVIKRISSSHEKLEKQKKRLWFEFKLLRYLGKDHTFMIIYSQILHNSILYLYIKIIYWLLKIIIFLSKEIYFLLIAYTNCSLF